MKEDMLWKKAKKMIRTGKNCKAMGLETDNTYKKRFAIMAMHDVARHNLILFFFLVIHSHSRTRLYLDGERLIWKK